MTRTELRSELELKNKTSVVELKVWKQLGLLHVNREVVILCSRVFVNDLFSGSASVQQQRFTPDPHFRDKTVDIQFNPGSNGNI